MKWLFLIQDWINIETKVWIVDRFRYTHSNVTKNHLISIFFHKSNARNHQTKFRYEKMWQCSILCRIWVWVLFSFLVKKMKYPTFTQERKQNYYFSFHPAIVIKHAKLVNRIIHVLASLIVPSVFHRVSSITLVFFSYEIRKIENMKY